MDSADQDQQQHQQRSSATSSPSIIQCHVCGALIDIHKYHQQQLQLGQGALANKQPLTAAVVVDRPQTATTLASASSSSSSIVRAARAAAATSPTLGDPLDPGADHHLHHQHQLNPLDQATQQQVDSESSEFINLTQAAAADVDPFNVASSIIGDDDDDDDSHDGDEQSTLSLGAATVAAAVANINNQHQQSSLIVAPSQTSSPNSSSPTSTIQADLSSSYSIASVVAAAAAIAAAAAANERQQDEQNPLHRNQTHATQQFNNQTSRLISSLSSSPGFYQHDLHQHNLQSAQTTNLKQQQHSPSPIMNFSPSTSVTPSSSSLLAQSRARSAASTSTNATGSSSLISPIASPNYLRRQFMPDRLHLLSPSPSSGLTTGTSSAASTSLAHILHQQQQQLQLQQQRSVSALGTSSTSILHHHHHTASTSSTPLSAGASSTAVSPLMNNKNSSQARLNNMQIRHKFGYLGSGRAQFNSPHGFCLGLNQEIVVADTNNHRVCIFDKSGTYLTQFGEAGKDEGQLWNPRKVAILYRTTNGTISNSNSNNNSNINSNTSHQQSNNQLMTSYSSHISNNNNNSNNSLNNGSTHISSQQSTLLSANNSEPLYVVCDRGAERSRMQLFTKDGAFIKKIGIHYIDIVAGLAITQNGLIIVVDSVSPTVYIINGETGVLNGWFDCSNHMKEPSDIAVKSDMPGNEYFICDFKGHCVVVFNEQGEYLRKIGHDGLTSYPNGIDISDDGDILVGDSHGNRFHVVVFDRNGK